MYYVTFADCSANIQARVYFRKYHKGGTKQNIEKVGGGGGGANKRNPDSGGESHNRIFPLCVRKWSWNETSKGAVRQQQFSD